MKPVKLPLKNHSSTITAGGTAQDVYSAVEAPQFMTLFQNVSDTDMTIEFDAPAQVGKGILVKAGVAYQTPPNVVFSGRLSVICATTGKAFVCKTC